MKYALILLAASCGTASRQPTYKDTVIYRVQYKDTTIYNVSTQDTIVYLPMYLPSYLKDAVKNGDVKFTIRYK